MIQEWANMVNEIGSFELDHYNDPERRAARLKAIANNKAKRMKDFLMRNKDRFVITDEDNNWLRIERPTSWNEQLKKYTFDPTKIPSYFSWENIDFPWYATTFKSESTARSFLNKFKDLREFDYTGHNNGKPLHSFHTEIKSILDLTPNRGYYQAIFDEIKGSSSVNENNDIAGTRYDWVKDFEFTDSVVKDLKERDLISIGTYLRVLLPINREDAPDYYPHDEYHSTQAKAWTDDNGKFQYERVPSERHDYDPYDILHIELHIDTNEKVIGIDRYYGHRKDWCGENHTDTHRDWTDVPVLTRHTVKSMIDIYRDNNICNNLKKDLEAYISQRVATDVKYHQRYSSNSSETLDEYKKRMYDKYFGYNTSKQVITLCDEISNGNIFNYEWKFIEPEEPTQEYIQKKSEDHKRSSEAISRAISEYYDKGGYTGD